MTCFEKVTHRGFCFEELCFHTEICVGNNQIEDTNFGIWNSVMLQGSQIKLEIIVSIWINDWCEKSDQEVKVGQVFVLALVEVGRLSTLNFLGCRIILVFPGNERLSVSEVFCGASVVKNPPANAGVPGSICGLGGSLGGGNGNPLQYSCLGNLMDRGVWRVTVHGVTKNWALNGNWTTTN